MPVSGDRGGLGRNMPIPLRLWMPWSISGMRSRYPTPSPMPVWRPRKRPPATSLPGSRVMSYPTCIFVDRMGKVRRIRTGFYGPGTGSIT